MGVCSLLLSSLLLKVVTRSGSTLRDGALFIRMAGLARKVDPEVLGVEACFSSRLRDSP